MPNSIRYGYGTRDKNYVVNQDMRNGRLPYMELEMKGDKKAGIEGRG